VSVWTGTDRVAHLLWRLTDPSSPRYDAALAAIYGDAITDMYRRMDDIVGQVRARLADGTTLIVMSDHGFHLFSRQFHVNTWLIDCGYLVLKSGGTSILDADWAQTRAYSLGTGQIYVNLQGREGQGIVTFGRIDALVDEIHDRLVVLTDPVGGAKVFVEVHKGRDLYVGGAPGAPDLQLAFASGYQTSWATKLGGVGARQFEDNPKKWSGDHAASAEAETRGVLFVSHPVTLDEPGIEDLAPTLLSGLGVALPPDLDGSRLW
jgi:predicted AlkP superfamily phosphohydrolase/phosphomutase